LGTKAFEDRVRSLVIADTRAQRLVGRTNPRRLVDAHLLGNGQVQREMQERVHLPALGTELLLDRRCRILEQRMVLGVLQDQVGGRHLGAFEDRALAMLLPRLTEELPHLLTRRVEHRLSFLVD
jgi:hypothetical protein